MADGIRKFEYTEKHRVNTGPIQFGDDWPGKRLPKNIGTSLHPDIGAAATADGAIILDLDPRCGQ